MLWLRVSHCEQIRCSIAQAVALYGRSADAGRLSIAVLAAQALGNMVLACAEDAEDMVEQMNATIRGDAEKLRIFGVDVHWAVLTPAWVSETSVLADSAG